NRPFHGVTPGQAAEWDRGRQRRRPPPWPAPEDEWPAITEARARLAGDEPVRVVARACGVSDKTLRATPARGAG
ncbi:MAG: hypothetical protein ABI376_00945, partial [Caulobacteraceae bacterium]